MLSDEEIEARFARIKQGLSTDLEDVDDKLSEILANTKAERLKDEEHEAYMGKLSDIDAKIQDAKLKYDKARKPANDGSLSGSMDQKSSMTMGMGISLAYTIIGAPIVGYGLGILINKLTHTQGWEIWLTLGGSILGIVWVVMVTNRHGNKF